MASPPRMIGERKRAADEPRATDKEIAGPMGTQEGVAAVA